MNTANKTNGADPGRADAQMGFRFFDAEQPPIFEQPLISWKEPEFTTDEYQKLFAGVQAGIALLPDFLRGLYSEGLAAKMKAHDEMMELSARATAFSLWGSSIECDPVSYAQFVDFCETVCKQENSGFETKSRHQLGYSVTALYAESVGTIIFRKWAIGRDESGSFGLSYSPWKDNFFNASFRDVCAKVFVPRKRVEGFCAAEKLSQTGAPSVPALMLNGREYVITGITWQHKGFECDAWAFCLLSEWGGKTYTYQEHGAAWDSGELQRGDETGRVLTVRGQRVVLTHMIRLYDEGA